VRYRRYRVWQTEDGAVDVVNYALIARTVALLQKGYGLLLLIALPLAGVLWRAKEANHFWFSAILGFAAPFARFFGARAVVRRQGRTVGTPTPHPRTSNIPIA
jgi:hypothetical protein